MPGVACKGKKPFNIQQETLRGAQFGKGQGFDTRKSKADDEGRQIEDPKTLKKGGSEGRKLA